MGWRARADRRAHRHKVECLAYALRSEETGNQDIRVRLVKLFAFRGVRCGSDLEAAALEIIQNSGEHAGRVESRKAEPVDRSVLTDQRGGLQIAYDSIIVDRLISQVCNVSDLIRILKTAIQRRGFGSLTRIHGAGAKVILSLTYG